MTDHQRRELRFIARASQSIFSISTEDDGSLLINWTDYAGRERQTQIMPDGEVI